MSQYNNDGKVSLWKRNPDAPDNAPVLKGPVYAHRDIAKGEKLDLALWRNDSDHPQAPYLTGKISDPFVKGQESQPKAEPKQNDFTDDDIPF